MLNRIREVRKNESGFTLIELLIVIVILGVLAGIVVFAVSGISDKGNTSACQTDVKTVTSAAEAYYAKNSAYATSINALVSAGFIHSTPNTKGAANGVDPASTAAADGSVVYYSADNTTDPKTVTVLGSQGSDCDGYKG